jgi:hypothetical protein
VKLFDYGVYTRLLDKCFRTEYANRYGVYQVILISLSQGYQILDDEVNITLDEFIETFADADGVTEYGPQKCSH